MSSTLRSTASLCLWPPYERFTFATNKGIQSFLVQDVPGDGSCFFHCLSVAIGGGLADSEMLRNVICGHILQNWRTLASGVSLRPKHRAVLTPIRPLSMFLYSPYPHIARVSLFHDNITTH